MDNEKKDKMRRRIPGARPGDRFVDIAIQSNMALSQRNKSPATPKKPGTKEWKMPSARIDRSDGMVYCPCLRCGHHQNAFPGVMTCSRCSRHFIAT